MRCYSQVYKGDLITKSPDWTISHYNRETKQVFHADRESYLRQLHATFSSFDLRKMPMVKMLDRTLIAGQMTDHYTWIVHLDGQDLRNRAALVRADYWLSRSIPTANENMRLLQDWFMLPAQPGIPLRFVVVNQAGDKTMLVNTTKCVASYVPASDFDAPVGFKPVKRLGELLMSFNPAGVEFLIDQEFARKGDVAHK